jgi:diaminopimelate decarboxylase
MNKPLYERPSLIRHQIGSMNKFGRMQTLRPLTTIDGIDLEGLVAEHGSPLYIISERSLAARYAELYEAFARRLPRVRIAWSYKTNYLKAVCRAFHRRGSWAEVVSPFEYDKALGSGVPPEKIHWNGPFKPDEHLERAVRGRSIIHVDNQDELSRLERIARVVGERPRVAVRVNMAIDGLTAWSRFGFNLEAGQAREALERIINGSALDLLGLHAHIGTFVSDPSAYRQAAAKLAALANDLYAQHGTILSFIDLGGGFASPNTLKGQYLQGEQTTPSFSRYADAISEGLSGLAYPPEQFPTLVLETGRALIDDAGTLVATVHATKRLPDGQQALVLDAGVNLLFTSYWYNHQVVPTREHRGPAQPVVLYGPLCMNIDVLRDSVALPRLEPGDRVAFKNVGAYNMTQWMQFIALRPAIVMIGHDGQVAVVRRAETLASIEELEELPEWLR